MDITAQYANAFDSYHQKAPSNKVFIPEPVKADPETIVTFLLQPITTASGNKRLALMIKAHGFHTLKSFIEEYQTNPDWVKTMKSTQSYNLKKIKNMLEPLGINLQVNLKDYFSE